MPTTINEMLKAFQLPQAKGVQWGEPITCQDEGIYIVSLSNNPNANDGIMKEAPISKPVIQKWLQKVDGFELDKKHTDDPDEIINRLSQFWLPDENIIYIGKAPKRKNKQGIGKGVNEFYKTEFSLKFYR